MNKILALSAVLLLTACGDDRPAAPPEPVAVIPADARDYFNRMGVQDSGGSKGQVRLHADGETLWFDSARTLLTYLRLPETANRPLSAYISAYDNPTQWLAVDDAWFVQTAQSAALIGKDDYFPFATQQAADDFAAAHDGKVLRAAAVSAEDLQL